MKIDWRIQVTLSHSILAVFLLVTLILSIFYIAIMPLHLERKSAIEALNTSEIRIHRIHRGLADSRAEAASLNTSLLLKPSSYREIAHPESSASELQSLLQSMLVQRNLLLSSMNVYHEATEHGLFKASAELQFKGELNSLVSFLDMMESTTPSLLIRSCFITNLNQAGTNSGPQIETRLEITAFYSNLSSEPSLASNR